MDSEIKRAPPLEITSEPGEHPKPGHPAELAAGSPEWQAARATRIGASEIAAVLGLDKYRSPVQLFMDKRRRQPSRPDPEDHRNWGLDMEPAILRNFARCEGYQLMRPPGLVTPVKVPHLCATPDGLGVKRGRVRDLQAKNVGEHHTREWGDPGTSWVPLVYLAQVTIELGVLRAGWDAEEQLEDEAELVVSFGGRAPVGYPVKFNPELFGNLSEAAERFVRDYLIPDKVPPLDGDRAALAFVRQEWRKSSGELLEPTAEATNLVGRLRVLKREIKKREWDHDDVQAKLCALIGSAYGFEGLCTWGVVPEQRQLVLDWRMVVENLIAMHQLDRQEIRALMEKWTHEEVTRESYRRLTLAKERQTS